MTDREIITSRDNAKLKLARSVRDGREDGLLFIEGVRLVREALSSSLPVKAAFVSTTFAADPRCSEIDEFLIATRSERFEVAEKTFRSIVDTENSQGIVLIGEKPSNSLASIRAGQIVVLLHRVKNPSNLGAVIRTAEAAGAAGLITTKGAASAFSPKALRASMGSAFRLPIVERLDYFEAIKWAAGRNLVTTGADLSGTGTYSEVDWRIPRLVVFGSEADGLDERELAAIDQTISIPMENEVESLNLAVSSGIILFEAKRQRDLA